MRHRHCHAAKGQIPRADVAGDPGGMSISSDSNNGNGKVVAR
jgi:hypothetical protein